MGNQEQFREPQQQQRPGLETKMDPAPQYESKITGTGKLKNKVAIVTGGDSGIGRAVAVLFAKEGADIAIVYYNEHDDALVTQTEVNKYGKRCLLIPGDVTEETFCYSVADKVMDEFGKIDILVNNAAIQYVRESILDIKTEELLRTFTTNIISFFWLIKGVLPYFKKGSCIINSTSVTAYRGSKHLMDYAATKGAIVAFTRSLSTNLVEKGIRVNAVAPGPIWTPLIVSSFDPEKVASHGSNPPLNRAGEPSEVAPSYLFLASEEDSSYITGQVLHPNGGEIING